MKKNIITYLLIFLILLLVSFLSQIDLDGIWEYGFSYNISQGLIPYKDFNMVVGPLYNLIFSIPMKLFGNYFYLFEIMHCILYAFIFTYMYKKIGKNTIFMILLLGLCYTVCGYNSFCLMLVLTILMLLDSDNKYKNIIIGLLIGTIFMTKHNIGIVLSIICIFTSKEKLKSLISILIPITLCLIYLVLNNALTGYIDYCYLGLGSFVDNIYIGPLSLIPFLISLYFLYKELKKYLKSDRTDKRILYVIGFYSFVFPILDQGHVVPVIVPLIYYLLSTNKNIRLLFLIKYFVIIGYVVTTVTLLSKSELILNNNYLKYQIAVKGLDNYLYNYNKYLNNYNKDYKVYLLVENSYIIRLYRNENPSFYDLINEGNLGTKEDKLIKDMDDDCENKKCLFILDNRYFKNKRYFQYSLKFKNHVSKKYKYIETMPSKDKVYTN